MRRSLLIATIVTLAATHAIAGDGRDVAIRGGTILTVTRGTIENGTILISDGTIAAVGSEVTIPPGADVIDAAGRYVMPGIIEAAKVYCTEQEVCDVFRDVFGQHQDRPEF